MVSASGKRILIENPENKLTLAKNFKK